MRALADFNCAEGRLESPKQQENETVCLGPGGPVIWSAYAHSFNSWLWKVTSEGMTARPGACCTPSSMNEPFCVWPLVKLRDNHVLELCSEFHEKL